MQIIDLILRLKQCLLEALNAREVQTNQYFSVFGHLDMSAFAFDAA